MPPLLFRLGLIDFETETGRLVRIATASGAAFLVGQLLDVTVFNWLRRQAWWRAPVFASLAGIGARHRDLLQRRFRCRLRLRRPGRRLRAGAGAAVRASWRRQTPRWVSWAVGDLAVKLIIAVFALIPYRLIAARWAQPRLAAA